MKLIGIGLENPPVRIPSYVSKASPRSVSRNALQRWYFTPNYDCVLVSQDEMGMELQGDGVQLISENQFVQANGMRGATGAVDRASESRNPALPAGMPDHRDRSLPDGDQTRPPDQQG